MNKFLSLGLNFVIPTISISTIAIANKHSNNSIGVKKYELLIDNEIKTFNSKQEAVDYLIKKGKPKIERHIGQKSFKNNDNVIDYNENKLAKFDLEKIKPAYKLKNGTFTPNRQAVINDYLSKSNITKSYLDLMGDEYDDENEAKQSILKTIKEDIMDNLFYEVKTDSGIKYYNPLVKKDMQQLFNDLISNAATNNLLTKNNGILLEDSNEKRLWIEHKEGFLSNIFQKLIEAYKNTFSKDIYKIEISLKHDKSWSKKWYKNHYAKFTNFTVEKNNSHWNFDNKNMTLYKYVDYGWLKKYLFNNNEKIFEDGNWKSIVNMFKEEVETKITHGKKDVSKPNSRRPKYVDWTYYHYGEQILKFNSDDSKFLDFKTLEMHAGSGETIDYDYPQNTKDVYLTSSIFQSTKKRSYHNYRLDISLQKYSDDYYMIANSINHYKQHQKELLVNKVLEQEFQKNNIFVENIKKMSSSLFNYLEKFIKRELSKNKLIKIKNRTISINLDHLDLLNDGEYINVSDFTNMYDAFEIIINSVNFQNFIESNFIDAYSINGEPFYYVTRNNNNKKMRLVNYEKFQHKDKNVLQTSLIDLNKKSTKFEKLINAIKNNEPIVENKNYDEIYDNVEKIEYLIKKQIQYAKTKNIDLNFNKSNFENDLLDFLENSLYFLLSDSKNIKLKLFDTFIYHKNKKFRFNNSYSKETVFTSKQELIKFKDEIINKGFIPRVKYSIDGLEALLEANNINLPKDFLEFNDPQMILQNYYMLLDKLIHPTTEKIYYEKDKQLILLATNFFNLWRFELDNQVYYFENENDLYKYAEKYVNFHVKERK